MANTKEIHIEVQVPFNWASELTATEAKIFSAYLLAPSGFRLKYLPGSLQIPIRGSSNGMMTMYRLSITGQEACWHDTLLLMLHALARQTFAHVIEARVRDLDNGGVWEQI